MNVRASACVFVPPSVRAKGPRNKRRSGICFPFRYQENGKNQGYNDSVREMGVKP